MNYDSKRHPILLFDGVCNLCNNVVKFTIKNDPEAIFRFASLQSKTGQEILKQFNLPHKDFSTFVLIEGNRAYYKSDAALRVIQKFGGAWRLASFFKLVPKLIRDSVYNLVATNRYNWFGRKDSCMVPAPELKDRFLE